MYKYTSMALMRSYLGERGIPIKASQHLLVRFCQCTSADDDTLRKLMPNYVMSRLW